MVTLSVIGNNYQEIKLKEEDVCLNDSRIFLFVCRIKQ